MVSFVSGDEAMDDGKPEDVTLSTLHEDLEAGFADLKGEVRTGFGDMKATMIAGFRNMPTREQSDEMIRLLREGNRLNEERFAQLDARIREQHLETQQVLRAIAQSQRALLEGTRGVQDGMRGLQEGVRALHEGVLALQESARTLREDMRALIARIDALIRGRGNGAPSS